MIELDIRLCSKQDPYAVGFIKLFYKILPFIYNDLVKKELIISNYQDGCDIATFNVDHRKNVPQNAKLAFTNYIEKFTPDNCFYFPYLENNDYDYLAIPQRFHGAIEKKYNCVAVFNLTHATREKIFPYLENFCEVVIINGGIKKAPLNFEFNDKDACHIFNQSKFSVCPPGNIPETYRYSEVLISNCIPLEIKGYSPIRLYSHPEEYLIDLNNINNYKLPEFNQDSLIKMQEYFSEKYLFNYVIDKMKKNGLFKE